jgi:hypothetical protein
MEQFSEQGLGLKGHAPSSWSSVPAEFEGVSLPPKPSDSAGSIFDELIRLRLPDEPGMVEEFGLADRLMIAGIIEESLGHLQSYPPDTVAAMTALWKLPEEVEIKYIRMVAPVALEATLREVSAGNPDSIRHLITSGFAVDTMPDRDALKKAAGIGLRNQLKVLSEEDTGSRRLPELSGMIAKLRCLADVPADKLWAGISPAVERFRDHPDVAALALPHVPLKIIRESEYRALPQAVLSRLEEVADEGGFIVPREVLHDGKVVPNQLGTIGKIAGDLYADGYGTELRIVDASYTATQGWGLDLNFIGFNRSLVQDVNCLEYDTRERIVRALRHEGKHLEHDLAALHDPDKAFLTTKVVPLSDIGMDSNLPYAKYFRADELVTYSSDAAHDPTKWPALIGKHIASYLSCVNDKIHEVSFSNGREGFPGRVIAAVVTESTESKKRFSLLIPLPSSLGVNSPQNQMLVDNAMDALRSCVVEYGGGLIEAADQRLKEDKEKFLEMMRAGRGLVEDPSPDHVMHHRGTEDEYLVWIRREKLLNCAVDLASTDSGAQEKAAYNLWLYNAPTEMVTSIRDEALQMLGEDVAAQARLLELLRDLP